MNKRKMWTIKNALIFTIVLLIFISSIYYVFSAKNWNFDLRSKAFLPSAPISGTFISFPGSRMANFTASDWQKQFDVMNSLGIDTVIVSGVMVKGFEDTNTRPYYNSVKYSVPGESTKDHLSAILDLADKYNIKVYVSPVDLKNYWEHKQEMYDLSISVANELKNKGYTTHPSFAGWYSQEEPFLNMTNEDLVRWGNFVRNYKAISNKPVIIAPFFIPPCKGDKSKVRCDNQWWPDRTPEQIAEQARQVMVVTGADILAIQDGVGASGVSLSELPSYLSSVENVMKQLNKTFWIDAEVFRFSDDRTKFVPASISDMTMQLNLMKKYKVVIWIFDQFMGPYNNELTYDLYSSYVKQYNLGTPVPYPFERSIFSDMTIDSWDYSYAKILYDKKITAGCSSNPLKFCPNVVVTRAAASILILKSMYGGSYNPPTPSLAKFTDVNSSYYAYSWINKLSELGITAGCSSNPLKFCPEYNLTRAQAAIMLVKAKKGTNYVPVYRKVFNDVPANLSGAAWITSFYDLGYTTGCGSNNFCPNKPLTRSEMAVFLVKVFNLK